MTPTDEMRSELRRYRAPIAATFLVLFALLAALSIQLARFSDAQEHGRDDAVAVILEALECKEPE